MRIDAHQHFWRLARGDYGWLTADLAVLYRDHEPAELKPLLKTARIDRTVLVQAAPTEAETSFLLDLAEATDFVAGVVGWVDFEAEDAADRIAALAARPRLVGLRPMIQDIPDVRWLLNEAIAPAVEAMVAQGLAFDALVKPDHLPILAEFAARHPGLEIVIDHGAKPDIAGGGLAEWAAIMRGVARDTGIACKLSGLANEAAAGWGVDDLRPYVEVLLEAFGPARLMWGSDWPVVNEAGGYAAWREAAEALTAGCSAQERSLIFGGTAARFYGLAA
jgi:L-fuconolactonase